MSKINAKVGKAGEILAGTYLAQKGYKTLYKNWRCRYGEIDLILVKTFEECKKLIFVEVKFVRSNTFCDCIELFSRRKKQHIVRAINYFLLKNFKFKVLWQLDVLCLTKNYENIWFEHFEDVLSSPP